MLCHAVLCCTLLFPAVSCRAVPCRAVPTAGHLQRWQRRASTRPCLVAGCHLLGNVPMVLPAPKAASPMPGDLPSRVPSAWGLCPGRCWGCGLCSALGFALTLGKPRPGPEPKAALSPQSHKPEKEWPVRNLRVYLGVKKKLRPPTCWGFTVFYENEKHEKQQWYLCCDTQADLREWFATFLHVQHGGALWPSETCKVRASRTQQDARLGNISLIPLRGNESEMRNSVAAFATDPLTLLRNV